MPRVLLLATTRSYRAGAFLDAAAREGLALTIGSERAQALAGFHPEAHLVLDFARPHEAIERIAAFHRDHPVAAVVAADDDGAVLAALAAERLGLAHAAVRAVIAARYKHRMRQVFAAAGVLQPGFRVIEAEADPAAVAAEIRYPCVLKPVALGASRGVIRCDDAAAFVAAHARIRALLDRERADGLARAMLAEDYVPGVELAVEALLVAGELHVLAMFDKPDPLEGPLFEETCYVTPSRLDPTARAAVVRALAQWTAALGLAHGPVHAELRVNAQGVWPIELAPRSIGGLCSRSLRFEGDRTLEQVLVRAAVGLDRTPPPRETAAAGVMMLPIPRAGVLQGVGGEDAARAVPHVEDVRMTVAPGERLEPLPEGGRYLGFVFARAERPAAVEDALRRAHAALTFDVEPTPEPTEMHP